MVTPEEAQEEAKIKAEEEVKRKAEEEAKRKAEEEEALLATERPTPTPTQALPEENGNPETTSPTPITPKPAKPAQPAQTAQSPQPDKLSVQQPSSTNQSTATATTESPSTAKTYKSFSQTPPPGSSKEPPGFFTKLFNVGDDGIMEMIKELVQAKWLKERCKDNKILFAALLPLNTVVAGLASAVLIGVGAVTAGILKGAYDVFDGLSSIIAELIVCVSGTPATSPLKPPHSTEIIKAGKTFGKGLAKFIIGSAIVAGIAMGGAGIAGVGAAAMLPVLTTIGKVISIGMLSLSSSAGLGLLTWVINKVAKRKKEEVDSKNAITIDANGSNNQLEITTNMVNRRPTLNISHPELPKNFDPVSGTAITPVPSREIKVLSQEGASNSTTTPPPKP